MNEIQSLITKRVAILATDGFEESELKEPLRALREAGADVKIVSPKAGEIRGWKHTDWSGKVPVDLDLASANAGDFDALVLPGGVMNPDRLRMNEKAVAFVKAFTDAGKPIGAICHGPWTLLETGALRGRTITSWPSLKTDLTNAGAKWVDREVVVDRGIVSSRKPDDLPAFNRKLIEEIREGIHADRDRDRGVA